LVAMLHGYVDLGDVPVCCILLGYSDTQWILAGYYYDISENV